MKTIVINGAYGGIGSVTAMQLAAEGYHLILLGRDEDKLKELHKRLVGKHVYYVLDATNLENFLKVMQTIQVAHEKIDVLINAAGVVPPIGDVLATTEEDWFSVINTSILGNVRLVKAFAPLMAKHKQGRIIIINGVLSQQPDPLFVISSTVTGAVRNFSKAISKGLAKEGIRVNLINPGLTVTPLMQTVVTRLATKFNSTFDSLVNQSTQNIPLGRLGKPQDVANYISFLCTEKADFINGTITNIDGGYSVSP